MQEFLTLALVHLLAVMAPGPDFAVTVRQSLIYGRRAGVLTAIGIGAGISVHVVYTLLGFGALLQTNTGIMRLAEYIGGLYLAYLGFSFIRHAIKSPAWSGSETISDKEDSAQSGTAITSNTVTTASSNCAIAPDAVATVPSASATAPEQVLDSAANTAPAPIDKAPATNLHSGKFFMMGFLTNATNPKATLFFLAVFTTIVSSSTPLPIQASYGLWMCLVNALWFILVSLAFTNRRVHQKFMRSSRYFEGLIGLLLLVLALRLFWPTY